MLVVKETEYIVKWGMEFVGSILEEKNVLFEAMSRSQKLIKGNLYRGSALVMEFLVIICKRRRGEKVGLKKIEPAESIIIIMEAPPSLFRDTIEILKSAVMCSSH
ncbi:hypothetical protein ACFE04_024581 [Oxalis oulophora]